MDKYIKSIEVRVLVGVFIAWLAVQALKSMGFDSDTIFTWAMLLTLVVGLYLSVNAKN